MNKFYYQELAEKFLEKVAQGILPWQRHKYIEHAPEHIEKMENPIASVKYDGANFWIKFDKEGKPSFISRRISVRGTPIDRTANLPHLAEIKLPQYAGTVVNAELIHNGFNKEAPESHGNVSGLLNSLPERAIRLQKETGPIRAVLFDVIEPKFNTYGEKLKYLKDLEKAARKPNVFFTPKVVQGAEAIAKLAEETRKKGHEGLIATSATKPEDQNPRYKLKHVETYNLKVIGITQAIDITGKPKNEMGALIVADCSGREVANVGTGFSRDLRIDAWKNKDKWIGKVIQVKTFGLAARRLRGPVYNGDADTNVADCILP